MFPLNLHAMLYSFGMCRAVFRCGCGTDFLGDRPVEWHFCPTHRHWRFLFLSYEGLADQRSHWMTSPN